MSPKQILNRTYEKAGVILELSSLGMLDGIYAKSIMLNVHSRMVITSDIRRIVDEQMCRDDETTASQLHALLTSMGYALNLRTIVQCRTSLGWTFRGSTYCQLIRDANKQKRLDFARKHRSNKFANMIFTDECTIQLETQR